MTQVSQAQQEELDKVLTLNTELERKYQSALGREHRLETLHADMEKKLRDTNVESIQVSSNLQDTHQWFKSKFDRIHEGDNSRVMQQPVSAQVMVTSQVTRHTWMRRHRRLRP
ncbi:hypothetical protein NP493_5665g00001 [Ridgeia piscesae]|uniref:Uncharacterized protein n=1 Tax=Ridgeia piscesae TaxID=27915 RepID=A0AAD9IUN2_RIDPI|nr:hypothetical protein NP493_5665g00001 [Ridgeia piscesae]